MAGELSGPIEPPTPSDSSVELTIGGESFPVTHREVIPGAACPTPVAEGEAPHPLYLVETEAAGTFEVCDVCSLSKRIAGP